ncbi:MAG: AMP-binding protein [Syntrophaceae bacterium]|nr:AMP-binding protein [Syntrophaceae bacterium]
MERPWLKFYDTHVPHSLEYPDIPLPRILDEAADRFPDRVGVLFFGARIRYRDLRAHANRFAHALQEIGVKKGGRLGLLMPNMPQTIISAFGAMKTGVLVFPFDPLLEEEELRRQINESGVETVVVLDLLLRRIDPIFAQTRVKNFIIAGVKDFLPFPRDLLFSLAAWGKRIQVKLAQKPNIHPFKDFLQKGRPEPPSAGEGQPGSEDAAVVQYTGGRTGPPKGVVLTHKNLVANLLQVSTWCGNLKKGGEGFFSILPFHQAFGMTLAVNLPVYLASGSIHQPRFDPLQFLNTVKALQPTAFPAQPAMIESLVWNPTLAKYRISSIRTCWSIGPSLPTEVLENYERKTGRRVHEGYGLTEASPLTHMNPFLGDRKPKSMGLPLPDTDARIVDSADGKTELTAGKTGELLIRGPQVMKGYWNRPEETARALRDGWLHTGDLAWMDEEGFFYFVDKMKKK